ncbi:protein of unknown function (DUF697) [Rubidibacter lacunae KORDI 51-2]|uniref:DUF697 domain-containing protein n=1 Tax=Rubidibacter lacunae KORDI 51-2 TaxID=582515 RepID=U5D815_9CHRO|nr:YcjF family protein [Rubidibacter lacunae]ERN40768.1 protein of unknown function (DUF697) [Rubidibacter lacunae KORDI 51-2]
MLEVTATATRSRQSSQLLGHGTLRENVKAMQESNKPMWRKPILIGGLGLSAALWAWSSLQDALWQTGEFGVLSLAAVGTGAWWLQQQSRRVPTPAATPVDRAALERELARVRAAIAQLQAEVPHADTAVWEGQLAQLPQTLERQKLRVAIAGGAGTGRAHLAQVLANEPIKAAIDIAETATPLVGTDDDAATRATVLAADLVVFLIHGDLTASEWDCMTFLRGERQRVLLALDRQDRFLPEERAAIWQQVRDRVCPTLDAADLVAIASAPAPVKVRRHADDGTVGEWLEQTAPDLIALRNRLQQLVATEQSQLVLAAAWRQARAIGADIKAQLNRARRERALPVIQNYQWLSAAAAFATPVASLDLLATAAINAQLVADLGAMYCQDFSWQQAQTAAGALGRLMAQLGLVELTTQAVAGLLKGNALTYAAGGLVQGVSAAYLTRLAGLSLIAYFEEQELPAGGELQGDRLQKHLQAIGEQTRRAAIFQDFVRGVAQQLQARAAAPAS